MARSNAISMPRSIDDNLNSVPGIEVYNVDTIKNRATEALAIRVAAIPMVEKIITDEMANFTNWTQEMAISPAIQQFKNQLEQIRLQEVNRALKNLGTAEQQLLETVTKNILQKIVKLPVLELKAACQRGESEALLEGLSQLFNLEKELV